MLQVYLRSFRISELDLPFIYIVLVTTNECAHLLLKAVRFVRRNASLLTLTNPSRNQTK